MAKAQPTVAINTIVVEFVIEKETKNTVKFAEVGEAFTHKIGALYVQKSALAELRSAGGAWPKTLTVTLESRVA